MNQGSSNPVAGGDELAPGPFRRVTAIVRTTVLEKVERELEAIHVPGISVTRVKGYGEYANFFTRDWMCAHARLEIYCRQERADEIAQCIMQSARTGGPGDGIVAVLPVESIYRIRSGDHASSDELGGCECKNPEHVRRQTGGPHGPVSR